MPVSLYRAYHKFLRIIVRKRLPTAFVYRYTQCLFLVVLLFSLLSVKLLSAEFAAASELSAEKFNGTYISRLLFPLIMVMFLVG